MTTVGYSEDIEKKQTSLFSVDNSDDAGLDSVSAGMRPLLSYCKTDNLKSGMRKAHLTMVHAVLHFVFLCRNLCIMDMDLDTTTEDVIKEVVE